MTVLYYAIVIHVTWLGGGGGGGWSREKGSRPLIYMYAWLGGIKKREDYLSYRTCVWFFWLCVNEICSIQEKVNIMSVFLCFVLSTHIMVFILKHKERDDFSRFLNRLLPKREEFHQISTSDFQLPQLQVRV